MYLRINNIYVYIIYSYVLLIYICSYEYISCLLALRMTQRATKITATHTSESENITTILMLTWAIFSIDQGLISNIVLGLSTSDILIVRCVLLGWRVSMQLTRYLKPLLLIHILTASFRLFWISGWKCRSMFSLLMSSSSIKWKSIFYQWIALKYSFVS